jgi:hypothetical protein
MDYRMGGHLHGQGEYKPEKKRAFVCEKCKGHWMVEHRVSVKENFQVLMGQELPEVDGISFRIYECIACGHYNLPPLAYTGTDAIAKLNAELNKVIADANKRRAKKPCTCPTDKS